MTAINASSNRAISMAIEKGDQRGLHMVLVGMALFTWGVLVPLSVLAHH